jgi:sugar (pentulose or hexulose) kinase
MDNYLLGIDIGTSGTKSVLFSTTGKPIARAYQAYPTDSYAPGSCEQDADAWWNAVVITVRRICPPDIAKHVKALSLSSQGGTVVPVGTDGKPLDCAIVWNDCRCSAQRAAFKRTFGESYMYRKSGWALTDGLPALQIARIRENNPAGFSKVAKFLTVPDFIIMKLTGVPVVDLSNAGINQLVDIQEGSYDSSILSFAGIDENHLATIVESGTPVGPLMGQAADQLGLPSSTMVVSGAHDQYAAALGAGIFEKGDILIGTGTAWAVCTITGRPSFDSGFSQSAAAVKGEWGSLVSIPNGGICLDWLKDKVFNSTVSYAEIDAKAAERPVGSNGLSFYPYFAGADFPHSDGCSKATFIGLDLMHDRFDMARAVMEGVSFQIGWILDAFREQCDLRRVVFAGGASKSSLWTQLSADIFGMPLHIPQMPDLSCVGAAVLAGVGSGVYSSAKEGYGILAVPERVCRPVQADVEQYVRLLNCYKKRGKGLGLMYGIGCS